jgi:hypothetical protein
MSTGPMGFGLPIRGGGDLTLKDAKVRDAGPTLSGGWEMNWIVYCSPSLRAPHAAHPTTRPLP